MPNYSLVQFGRNAFEAGETKEIELDFPVERLRVVDEEGNYVWENAKVYLYVGGSQPDERSCALTGHRGAACGAVYDGGRESSAGVRQEGGMRRA